MEKKINSLSYENNLYQEFKNWAVNFLVNNGDTYALKGKAGRISITKLVRYLSVLNEEDLITENDIIDKTFDPSRICSKLLKIKNSNKWYRDMSISSVPCHPKIQQDFYDWAVILLEKHESSHIKIQEVLNLFPEYTVEPSLKECLITSKDMDGDHFILSSIRDKLKKMVSLKGNCSISAIPCEKKIKKGFIRLISKNSTTIC